MKEVVTLAIVGAAVGGRAQADGERRTRDQEKEGGGKETVCSLVFGN